MVSLPLTLISKGQITWPGLEMCGLLHDTTINININNQKSQWLKGGSHSAFFLPWYSLIYKALRTRLVTPSDILLNASGTRNLKTKRLWRALELTEHNGPEQGHELKGFHVCAAKWALWWEHSWNQPTVHGLPFKTTQTPSTISIQTHNID